MGRMKEHVMASLIEDLAATDQPAPGLVEALAAAQVEMRNPVFDKVNPHFKSKFASLAAVRDAVVPVLSRHGIAMVQSFGIEDGCQVLNTVLMYGRDRLVSTVPLPAYQNSQQWASATTYIRRVSLMAIAGVCGDEDDDAEAAVATHRQSPLKAAPAGFESWWADMAALVDDGSDALRVAWTAASIDYRNHVQSVHGSEWASMKAKAAKVAA